MQIGDIIEVDGIRRKVVSFTLAENRLCPNTIPAPAEEQTVAEAPAQEEAPKAEKKPSKTVEMQKCPWCGAEFRTTAMLKNHMRYCKQKPTETK